MKKKLILVVSVFLLLSSTLWAQKEAIVYSESMQKEITNQIFIPENYDSSKKYPVIYLLHGHGGDSKSWGQIKNSLQAEASKYDLLIVCPDGENSWYWDSPIDNKMKYDTYVSKELVNYVDSNFSTIQSPAGRAVTGLSMGGHGGLWLGINHPNIFGACGAMSGGVDTRPFPGNWNMKDSLGKYSENKEVWDEHTVINQLYKIEPKTLKIIVDCGYDDFFYEVNEELHKQMLYMKIEHDYIVRPGAHNAAYWRNAVDYQILFFHKFFKGE